MKGKIVVVLIVCISALLCGCSKKEIDPVSQKMINDISALGEITLDDEVQINKLMETYATLTEIQKGQVTNYVDLLNAIDVIDELKKVSIETGNNSEANAETNVKHDDAYNVENEAIKLVINTSVTDTSTDYTEFDPGVEVLYLHSIFLEEVTNFNAYGTVLYPDGRTATATVLENATGSGDKYLTLSQMVQTLDTGRYIYTVYNTDTGELLAQKTFWINDYKNWSSVACYVYPYQTVDPTLGQKEFEYGVRELVFHCMLVGPPTPANSKLVRVEYDTPTGSQVDYAYVGYPGSVANNILRFSDSSALERGTYTAKFYFDETNELLDSITIKIK